MNPRYIYNLIIAIDANFRLKRRAVSSEQRDPALGSGTGYFVENTMYRDYYMKFATQEDVRDISCSVIDTDDMGFARLVPVPVSRPSPRQIREITKATP